MNDDALGHEQARLLHRALERAGIPPRRLWSHYAGLGGALGPLEVEAYLYRCLRLSPAERDLLAQAANALLDHRFQLWAPFTTDLMRREAGGEEPGPAR
ncbi:hypothetical protein GCM10011374_31130 [Kocuria dechangensis]|uniref:Uncharacterized protein n=1 Tax=Kocuria dechangensis TaxID=1176249 RepID=A0A917H2Y4_9MICC|nr:hypothetical protein [Kocuria dechangensis]GGG65128.1 hypothetical protein GCM10011374_31130 [Kocuria dechangensis]